MTQASFDNGEINVDLSSGQSEEDYVLRITVKKRQHEFPVTTYDTLIVALVLVANDIGLQFGPIRDWCVQVLLEEEMADW